MSIAAGNPDRPGFDPALETSLHKTLSDVGTQIAEKASEDSKPETDAGQSAVPEKAAFDEKPQEKTLEGVCRSFAAAALCAGMSLIFGTIPRNIGMKRLLCR